MLSTVSALAHRISGAGKPERARLTLRYAAFIAICFGACMVILMQFAAEPVVSLFTDSAQSDGAEVIVWAVSICADMYGTAYSQASTSASAVTSVPAEDQGFLFSIIFPRSFWYVCPAFT